MTQTRGVGGYIDPLMTVLPIAFLAVVFAVPALVTAFVETPPVSPASWARLTVVAGVLLVLQAVAVAMALEEAHHDALSGGMRVGLNRAPALQGLRAPAGLAAIYLIGIWSLWRVEAARLWAAGAYGTLFLVLLGAGALASLRGRAGRVRRSGPERLPG